MEITGIVKEISHHGKQAQFHALHLEVEGEKDRRFGTDGDDPEIHGVKIGDIVQLTGFKNEAGFWQTDLAAMQRLDSLPEVVQPTRTSVATSKGDYWANKEANDKTKDLVIQLQSCRNSAIDIVRLLLDQDALKLPATLAKKYDVINAEVEEQVAKFWAQNADMRDGSSGLHTVNGSGTSDPTDPVLEGSPAETTEVWG